MAKPELGTKRTCPETGRKFYDLNKTPIVSPYTGTEYPLSFFETPVKKPAKSRAVAEAKTGVANEAAVEDEGELEADDAVVSLEEAAEEAGENVGVDDEEDDAAADIPDIEDDDLGSDNDDNDSFLETDDEDDDVSDILVGDVEPDGDEET